MSDTPITSSKLVRLAFPSHNCLRRVITLGDSLFADDSYTQSEISQMGGAFFHLTEDQGTRLVNKINDLEREFRPKGQHKGKGAVEGHRLSHREVVELAMNEVLAGVRVGSRKL